MSRGNCAAPIPFDALVAYWLDELDERHEAQLEEHMLSCGDCTAAFQSVIDLAVGIRMFVQRGELRAVVTNAFAKRLAEEGLRLREYRVPRNGGIYCTVAPEDDVAIARLEAPLAGVGKLDLVLFDVEGKGHERLENVPFNAAAGEVVITPNIENLRALPASTRRLQLIAVERGSDRVIGEYTFHHTPWAAP